MAKFPEPPAAKDLAKVSPDPKVLSAGTLLWRLYFRGGRHPNFWNAFRSYGPTSSRFDHHLPPPRVQTRMVFYCAEQGPTCLAEVFQDTRVIDRTAREPWLVGFALLREVKALDMTGSWPTRAGASMAINSGPRPRAQRWSRAIYDAYPDLQGVYYGSSMYGNRPAVALYERALAALPSVPAFHRPLADPTLLSVLKHVALNIGYGLV
ncbi:MAG TPA: RES family NAD+ phosphorylase [Thermoanaerobaculia bacterium]|nr:RES family NAD+ phosphorylase [Thermoanaerobaculia bacterium]